MARTIALACVSILLVAAVIRQPDATFQASLQGLTLWWTIIFPGLMPFIVLSELMTIFGVTALAGRLLEPAMERLFRLPGDAGIAVAAGWTGGYAAGSEAAAELHRSGKLTRPQGQRLLALAHMPNPLFMLIVVGAGFMKQPSAGISIAIAVWISGLLAAFFSSLIERLNRQSAQHTHRNSSEPSERLSHPTSFIAKTEQTGSNPNHKNLFVRAESARRSKYEADGRSFGQALGDSTIAAVQKLLVAGGIIIISAVLVRMVEPLWDTIDGLLHLPNWLLPALLESHLGAYAASTSPIHSSSAAWPAAAAAAALAWSGLGAIAQASAAIAGTDLKLLPFIMNRAVHALLAAAAAVLIWRPVSSMLAAAGEVGVLPAMMTDRVTLPSFYRASDIPSLWPFVPAALCAFLLLIAALAALSLTIRTIVSKR
ncbi:nucleoside recognition domain-containing protein [Paenibacillus kobensis]|uniref:nucleoside recognition domain-containing protein n=1 Tax=Paenibacillus kobensis TaxID=59841 RepID=UPI000FD918B6|nr:nucleoside recognition domain-containing protein [Paenibacillus kobensis]